MALTDCGPIVLLLFLLPYNHGYDVYWNVPTSMCKSHGVNFDVTKYNIKQNEDDNLRGSVMNILYYPGEFPYITEDGEWKYGGLPQKGNLTRHLEVLARDVKRLVPENSAGLVVIDQEHWRPLFYQNWARHEVYRRESLNHVEKDHPKWSKKQVRKEAKKQFNEAARKYMEETLKVCKSLRPKATWGYYHFPYCFNNKPPSKSCNNRTQKANNKIQWLFDASDALFPCIYVSSAMTDEERRTHVYGRINEARRVADNSKHKPLVIPYARIRLRPTEQYVSMTVLKNTFGLAMEMGAEGSVIWERNMNVKSITLCHSLKDYTTNTLGPFIKTLTDN